MAYYTQYNVKENGRSTLRGLLTDKDRLIANIRDGDKDMQRDFIIRRMMFKLNNLIDFAKKCVTLNGEYNKIDTANEKNKEKLIKLGGKRQVPFMVDNDRNIQMYESEDIIKYLKSII